MTADLIERARRAMGGLELLTGYGEDAVWRPANKAWEAMRDLIDALADGKECAPKARTDFFGLAKPSIALLTEAHPDWHLCCEPAPDMLAAGYIDAEGERHDLTPDEMRSVWFRMHAAIRSDA